MEYQLTDIGPCRKRLVFTFDVAEVDAALDESYAEVDQHVQIKGFRRGKAPRRILEKKFGREAALSAEESLAEKNIGNTLEKEKITLLGQPDSKTSKGTLTPHTPFIVEIEFDCRPDFDMPAYKGLELKTMPVPVTDAELEDRMKNLQTMFAKYDVVDGGAEKGDILNVNFKAEADGKEIMNMTDRNLRVEGDRLFGLPFPELEEKFTGVKAGDEVSLSITLPEDHPDEELKNKVANVSLAVNRVERPNLPEMNDEFAASVGMNNLEDFRNRVKANMEREAVAATRERQEDEIVDLLIAGCEFPLPEKYIHNKVHYLMDQQRAELAKRGIQAPDPETMHADAEKVAERQARWEIIASRISEQENLSVEQEEVGRHIENLASSFNTTPAKIVQRIRDFNGGPAMMKEILDLKVMQLIIDNAKIDAGDPAKNSAEVEEANAAAVDSANGGEGE